MDFAVTTDALQGLLDETPFNRLFGFRVAAIADGVCALHVPHQPIFARPDGLLSGPVFMAAADVAMWLAIMTRTGIIDRLVTVEMKTNFLAGARGADVTCTATVLRLGKRLIYGTAECRDPAAALLTHHTLTYIRP